MPYEVNLKLEHNESPAKVNMATGEICMLSTKKRFSNLKDDENIILPKGKFTKVFDVTRSFLLERLSKTEWWVLSIMIERALPGTNSMEPIDDDTSMRELERIFKTDRQVLKRALDKLFDIGAYANYSISESGERKKYWLLNPYVSFKGRKSNSDIMKIFDKTDIAVYYKNVCMGLKN